jgi:hypothetical protein
MTTEKKKSVKVYLSDHKWLMKQKADTGLSITEIIHGMVNEQKREAEKRGNAGQQQNQTR